MTVEDLIRKHEGARDNIYTDQYGNPTIGVGHNLAASPLPNGMSAPLTTDEIDELFQQDLAVVQTRLRDNLVCYADLDLVRQAVLQDMCFNMGWSTLATFKTFLELVAEGNWQGAATDMLGTLWASQVRSRALEDSNMLRSGLWPIGDDESTPTV